VIVISAVALPLASNVMEFGLREQVGEPACAGCTEQARETGLSNAFRRFMLTVEVARWPELRVSGVRVEAKIEKSVLTMFTSTLTVLSPWFATTMSGDLSWFRSAVAIWLGEDPTLKAMAV